ncbi:radical SAM protein [Clostridium botulinum]|uniref:Radical SAM domain protein n=2 Tax=Clostridium botulinum TaxID=1491 RepID=A5I5F1_CLOBH|nr:radical SAM protein [Clostridium botulinum]EPS50237.1 radical SAM domain-containing protein [Clostridium botulinum CFSAN002369]ABS33702.1 radical SAM domain protein [Clostridium botulinum A str. ATCC 19397]ABS36515.1 radical SAM domain protein [Clostridium botulinum A str. Hall]APH24582.1 radical SAM superfamily protein [Clostridium botulinum]APQ67287.1 radical SAM superfamily protein [Clostridium botulinum]
MILRAKTIDLFKSNNLNECQKSNSELNIKEIKENKTILKSYPRRLVFELTNACNLNCVMCGRNDAYFKPTIFDINWIDKFSNIMDKIEEVTLMGWGEPTMHPNFKEILEKINRYNVRKYFCTNGMKLGELQESIFENKVDIIAVSLDGANKNTNDTIRRGSDFDKVIKYLKNIVEERNKRNVSYPYINFVFTAMKSNYKEIPDMIKLAHEIGIEEVKVVYLTAFSDKMIQDTLYNCKDEVSKIFDEAVKLAKKLGVKIKLPYIQGGDMAENKFHKECYVGWRDFFLGSDGYVRPCMSTPIKFFSIDKYCSFSEIWNSEKFINFRENVNDSKKMYKSCKMCYQSSYANWNNKSSFIQVGNEFSPEWEK